MFGWLLMLTLTLLGVGVMFGLWVGGLLLLRWAKTQAGEDQVFGNICGAGLLVCALISSLFVLGVMTGQITTDKSRPDGCYRLTTVQSGKTTTQQYEVIPCP